MSYKHRLHNTGCKLNMYYVPHKVSLSLAPPWKHVHVYYCLLFPVVAIQAKWTVPSYSHVRGGFIKVYLHWTCDSPEKQVTHSVPDSS